jgi:hypothetical protein
VLGASRPGAPPSASGAGGGTVAVGNDGDAAIEVACPADAAKPCAGTVGLAADAGAHASSARPVPDDAVQLASADFSARPGETVSVRLPLPLSVRNTVERAGRMAVFATLDLGDGRPVRGDDLVLTPDPRTARLLDAGSELTVREGIVALRLRCPRKCDGAVAIGHVAKAFRGRRITVRLKVGRKRGTQSVRITTKPALVKRLSVTLRAKEARR